MEKKILAYPVHLLRRFVLGAAISSMALALPAPLEAIDVVKQALAGQQADVPFAEQSKKINDYQLRRAQLLQRTIESDGLARMRHGFVAEIGAVVADKVGLGAVFNKAIGDYSDRHFRAVLVETRQRDEVLYGNLITSQPNSAKRASLLAQAIDSSNLFSSVLQEAANDEQRLALSEYSLHQIERNLAINFHEDATFRDDVQGDIGEIEAELGAFGDQLAGQQEQLLSVSQHLSEHNAMMGQLVDDVVQLQQQTIALNESHKHLDANDQFTHGLLYELLPDERKLEALKNDTFLQGSFTPEKREQAIAQLEVKVQARKVVETVGQITATTQVVAQGLAEIGLLDQEDLADVNEAVQITTAAFQIGTSITTGNVLGVIAGISGLFGGGGGSGLSEAVREELAKIDQKLDEIARKLDMLNQKVDRVIELQQDTLMAIGNLERTTIERFDSVDRSIKEVQWEITVLRRLFLSESFGSVTLKECEIFANSRSDQDKFALIEHSAGYVSAIVDFDIGEFTDWERLASHYRSNMNEWQACYGAIRKIFDGKIHNRFRMTNYTKNDGEDSGTGVYSGYIEPGFNPLSRLLSRHFPLNDGDPRSDATQSAMRTFCALLNAPDNYDAIDFRGYRFTHTDYFDYCHYNVRERKINPIITLIEQRSSDSQLVHPDTLIFYAYLMMEILPYKSMVDNNDALLSPEELMKYDTDGRDERATRNEINRIVKTAYRLISVAIAQQVLLTGDFMLPVLHGYLSNPEAADHLRDDAVAVLTHNSHLASNYFIMQFHRELQRRIHPEHAHLSDKDVLAKNFDQYDLIYQCRANANRGTITFRGKEKSCVTKSELVYEQLFASYWQFSQDSNEVIVGDMRHPMPSPQDIATQRYHTTQEYQELLVLRSRILDFALRNDLPFVKDLDAVVDDDGVYKWL